jgi:hypothetical protein
VISLTVTILEDQIETQDLAKQKSSLLLVSRVCGAELDVSRDAGAAVDQLCFDWREVVPEASVGRAQAGVRGEADGPAQRSRRGWA